MKFWTGLIIGALLVIVSVVLALSVNVTREPLPEPPTIPQPAPESLPSMPSTAPAATDPES